MKNIKSEDDRKKIVTVPNLLSLLRFCLIPFIMCLYIEKGDHLMTLVLLVISGVTDVVDGIIARKFDMVSDFGKAFDPVADKLTQIATLFCLITRFSYMLLPLLLLVGKEVVTGITSLLTIQRTGEVNGALWHGKLTTVALYAMMGIHVIWSNIPRGISLVLVGICIGMMLMSFIMYFVRNLKAIRSGSFEI